MATTAIYLYGCTHADHLRWSPRPVMLATLKLSGLRVGELCQLNNRDINLARGGKTAAGVRSVDIHRRLLDAQL